jgi:hypothetical protein
MIATGQTFEGLALKTSTTEVEKKSMQKVVNIRCVDYMYVRQNLETSHILNIMLHVLLCYINYYLLQRFV